MLKTFFFFEISFEMKMIENVICAKSQIVRLHVMVWVSVGLSKQHRQKLLRLMTKSKMKNRRTKSKSLILPPQKKSVCRL